MAKLYRLGRIGIKRRRIIMEQLRDNIWCTKRHFGTFGIFANLMLRIVNALKMHTILSIGTDTTNIEMRWFPNVKPI